MDRVVRSMRSTRASASFLRCSEALVAICSTAGDMRGRGECTVSGVHNQQQDGSGFHENRRFRRVQAIPSNYPIICSKFVSRSHELLTVGGFNDLFRTPTEHPAIQYTTMFYPKRKGPRSIQAVHDNLTSIGSSKPPMSFNRSVAVFSFGETLTATWARSG